MIPISVTLKSAYLLEPNSDVIKIDMRKDASHAVTIQYSMVIRMNHLAAKPKCFLALVNMR